MHIVEITQLKFRSVMESREGEKGELPNGDAVRGMVFDVNTEGTDGVTRWMEAILGEDLKLVRAIRMKRTRMDDQRRIDRVESPRSLIICNVSQ